jgi:hypothetical protein
MHTHAGGGIGFIDGMRGQIIWLDESVDSDEPGLLSTECGIPNKVLRDSARVFVPGTAFMDAFYAYFCVRRLYVEKMRFKL